MATRPAASQPAPDAESLPALPAGKAWKLVWHDEFGGTRLDERKWVSPPDAPRRDGWWVRRVVSVDGLGHLVMQTRKEGDKYLSGCVRTLGTFEHAFGYYVTRIRLQKQPGHWPAFWLMGRTVFKVGDEGRDGTEIDIMEHPALDDRMNHALHWDGYGKEHRSAVHKFEAPGISEGFHTFGLWWSPKEYVFYVDGRKTWRQRPAAFARCRSTSS